MNVICYVCHKDTSQWCQNLTETKSQHTATPISEFIKSFLGNFCSKRNIDDVSNCICVDCLQQINDYDRMKRKFVEMESKFRHSLLATEAKLNIKSKPIEIKNGFGVDTFELNTSADDLNEQQSKALAPSKSSRQPSTSSSMLNPRRNHKSKSAAASTSKSQANEIKVTVTEYPKPAFSYSCLIAMALKNSQSGLLRVSEIFSFICQHFPYFKMAPIGWKNAIRHDLTTKKSFKKCKVPVRNGGWLWTMDPSKMAMMDEKLQFQSCKNPASVRSAMAVPENLPALLRGEMKHGKLNDIYIGVDEDDIELETASKVKNRTPFELQANEMDSTVSKHLKPAYSHPCLIVMALKNSRSGLLSVSEIYNFLCEHFPYFRTVSTDCKRNIRNNLSLNKQYFENIGVIDDGWRNERLWKMNPAKIGMMDEKIEKCSNSIINRYAMAVPENLPALLRGEMKHGGWNCSRDIESDDSVESECENVPVDSGINSEENIQAEFLGDTSVAFDKIDIDDSKPFQFALNAEDSQTGLFDSDTEPMEKYARFDVNYYYPSMDTRHNQ